MEEKDIKLLVIERAKEIFKVYGYKKTSMEDIAKSCNKSKGLLYHYYNSKEEIFKIIVNNEVSLLLSNLKKNVNSQISVKEKFKYFFSTTSNWFSDNANMYNKIMMEIFDYLDLIKDEIITFNSEIVNILKTILKEGVKANSLTIDNIEATAISLLSMTLSIMYTPLKMIFNINDNDKVDIDRFIKIIYYGLVKR